MIPSPGSKDRQEGIIRPSKATEQLTPRSIYTMEQIGLEGHVMPLHAATDPFPLFPETAMVKRIWSRSSIRSFCPNRHTHVPFRIDVRKLLEVLDRTSEVAGN